MCPSLPTAVRLNEFAQDRPARRINPRVRGDLSAELPRPSVDLSQEPTLHILCRSLSQLDAVINGGASSLMVDFQDIREYRVAVATARRHDVEILLATPRIQKPDEVGIFRAMRKHGADGWLVRNLAGVQFCAEQQIPFDCDFSLNAANQLTVEHLRELGARPCRTI